MPHRNLAHLLCAACLAVYGTVLKAVPVRAAIAAPISEWTLMVFMNGKNNLEAAALDDFAEMARVGSSEKVNVVVQLGRPRHHWDNRFGAWSGVKRYRIDKSSQPRANEALATLDEDSQEADMGASESLVSFVTWVKQRYPAKKQMLIIWNHGQGWRLQVAATKPPTTTADAQGSASTLPDPVIGGVRSVSHDADTGSVLYNRQIQDALGEALHGKALDVIAFDACLMAMVETAYAMRGIATWMVASEELEPASGWQYDTWLQAVAARPQASARELAQMAVASYRDRYGDLYKTTLSAVDLSKIGNFVQSLSELVKVLREAAPAGATRVREVRANMQSYGDGLTQPNYIDLGGLLDGLSGGAPTDPVGSAARRTRMLLGEMVTANYRSARVSKGYGSSGLSVFYPASIQALRADPDAAAYTPSNNEWPVAFVTESAWSCFLLRDLLGVAADVAVQGCE